MARTVTLTYRNLVFLIALPWLLLVGMLFAQQAEIRELRADVIRVHIAQASDTDAFAEILARLTKILGN